MDISKILEDIVANLESSKEFYERERRSGSVNEIRFIEITGILSGLDTAIRTIKTTASFVATQPPRYASKKDYENETA